MKRNSFLLTITALMVFSFGLAYGAQEVTLESVNTFAGDTVQMGVQVSVFFRATNTPGTGYKVAGSTNGFQVWTHQNGAYTDGFSPMVLDTVTVPGGWKGIYDLPSGGAFNAFSVDGVGRDTIGYGGAAAFGATGMPDGFSQIAWVVRTTPDQDGDTLCVDSSFYPPGGAWLWSTTKPANPPIALQPAWSGPFCYHVYNVPDIGPSITNCPPGALNFDHCVVGQYDFNHTNPGPSTATVYSVAAGPGSVDQNGNWSYAAPSCTTVTVTVRVTDPNTSQFNECTFDVNYTNSTVGSFTDGCGDSLNVGRGNTINFDIDAIPGDCDNITYIICDVSPAPAGSYSINANTGQVTFNTDFSDAPTCFDFTIGIVDECNDTLCDCVTKVCVLATEPFEVVIEKTHQSYQGQHEYVDVTVEAGSEKIGGFDLLFCYDRSCLNFQSVAAGDLHSQCGWEYYTYRTWFWPSYEPHFFWGGCVRVIAIADQNNGNNHPSCNILPTPYTLFTIDVLVTDNRLFECQYCAIRFFWTDCGDNVFSNISGDTLWVSREVIEFGSGQNIADDNTGFPTYTGYQADCNDQQGPDKPLPISFIDFFNGGVDVACAESIDARGDINLNGIANEIADAVVLTNYFIYGLGAFHINIAGQTAASDVNADGLALTVGDLVYLIRVIVGDALPYPKLAPVAASYTIKDGIISVDAEMGAASVMIRGEANPTLLANGMEMKSNYDAQENITRVIVYSFEGNGFSGEFLNANGEVVSMELGSYEGAVVKATELPADYALNQNYPNPFNPSTTVSFNLPKKADYTLTIYNVTGQMVKEFAGTAEAGQVSLVFDASNLASGIYFYKLATEEFSATKKMVLLK